MPRIRVHTRSGSVINHYGRVAPALVRRRKGAALNNKQSEAHRFLSSYRVRKKQIDRIADEYADAVASAIRITASTEGVGGSNPSPSAGKMTDAADRMLAVAERMEANAADMAAEWEKRNEVINAVAARNSLCGLILQLRYCEDMTVPEAVRYLERDRRHPYARSSGYRLAERALTMAHAEMERLGYCEKGEGL